MYFRSILLVPHSRRSHFFDLITIILFFEEYRYWRSSLCSFLHFTFICSLKIGYFFSAPYSQTRRVCVVSLRRGTRFREFQANIFENDDWPTDWRTCAVGSVCNWSMRWEYRRWPGTCKEVSGVQTAAVSTWCQCAETAEKSMDWSRPKSFA